MIKDLLKKNFKLLFWRLKTPFAEVDLIFRDLEGRLCVVEVKTSLHEPFAEHRVSFKQRARLSRARAFIEETWGFEAYLQLALVEKNQIHYYEL